MHTSLRVIGVLPDLVVSVVLGLGFCRWAAAQAVHEPSVSDVPSSRTFGSGTPIGTAWRELTESAPIRPQRCDTSPHQPGGVIAVKFGVVEAPLHSRFGPMMVAETGYRTARVTGADSYWLPDHLNAFCPGP